MSFQSYLIAKGFASDTAGSFNTFDNINHEYKKEGFISIVYGLSELGQPPSVVYPDVLMMDGQWKHFRQSELAGLERTLSHDELFNLLQDV